MANFLITSLLSLQVIILILILLRLNKLETKENLFVVSNSVLHDTINLYFQTILQEKIEALSSQYDLDPKSKTQAIKAYNESCNLLLSQAAKDIMRNYLSKDCLKILLKFYSIDGLILTIISKLKG